MNLGHVSLAELHCNETACLVEINASPETRERLAALGFLPETELSYMYAAPTGSPIAVWVRGTMISLRRSLCKNILVRGIPR